MSFSYFDGDPHLAGNCYYKNAIVVEDDDLLPKIITNRVWSPVVWRDGRRRGENFVHADYLAMDFDEGDPTLSDMLRETCDMKRIIGTTKSHQKPKGAKPPCDRYRVLIPFERRITELSEFLGTMDDVVKKYPSVDKSALLGSQYFRKCSEIVVADYTDKDLYSWPVSKPRRERVFAKVHKVAPGGVPYDSPAIRRLKHWSPNHGHRHNVLLSASISMAGQGFAVEKIWDYLNTFIPTTHDFTDYEKMRIMRSACGYANNSR